MGIEKAGLDQKVEELNTLYTKHPPNFAVVIDNFDLRVEAADMTSDNQTKDLHWVNHNAILYYTFLPWGVSFRQTFSLCITKSGELEGCGDRFTLQASTG